MDTLRRLLPSASSLIIFEAAGRHQNFTRAANELGYSDLAESLKGPNAFAFSKDAVAPARVLAKFAKKNELLVLKGGVVEGKTADLAGVLGGDILTKIRDCPVKEVYSYMDCLSKLNPGDEKELTVLREGKEVVLKAKF